MRNEAARFVTLIDALYEHKVKLLAAADAEPAGLYPARRRQLRVPAHRQPARRDAKRRISGRRARRASLTSGAGRVASRNPGEKSSCVSCSGLCLPSRPPPPSLRPIRGPFRASCPRRGRRKPATYSSRRSRFPTVHHRGEMQRMAKLLADQFRAAGIPEADIHIMPYEALPGDKTAALIVRWRSPQRDQKADADPRPHGCGRGQARGLEVRPLRVPRGRRLFLRPRHQRHEERRRRHHHGGGQADERRASNPTATSSSSTAATRKPMARARRSARPNGATSPMPSSG